MAPRANRFSINHHAHDIIEESDIEDDPNTYPQLTKNIYIKSEYLFNIDITKKI